MANCDHSGKTWRSETSNEYRSNPNDSSKQQYRQRTDYYCECGTWMKGEVTRDWTDT